MRNILIAQLILVPVVAAVFLLVGEGRALAALFGGGIAIVNTLLLMRRVANANRRLSRDPSADVRSLYVGAAERFVFTLGALALGMGWLQLNPIALLTGFALAYLGHPLSRAFPGAETESGGR